MTGLIITLSIIGIAAIVMLIKCPGPALGYIYCVAVGLVLAGKFLYPYTSSSYEVLNCLTLGGGIGAVFGLFYAVAINNAEISTIIACALILPIVMFVVGFILVLIIGLYLMIKNGSGGVIAGSVMIFLGLIGAIVGGGGSIILIVLDK